jgi:hypothetical protein
MKLQVSFPRMCQKRYLMSLWYQTLNIEYSEESTIALHNPTLVTKGVWSASTPGHVSLAEQCLSKEAIYDSCKLLSANSVSGSSDSIATGYWLDGPGIEPRWGRDFLYLFRPALEPIQPPVQWVPGLSGGRKRPERDADPSPLSSAKV